MTEQRRSGLRSRVGDRFSRLLNPARKAPPPKVAPHHPMLNNSIVDCALYVGGVRQTDELPLAARRIHRPAAPGFRARRVPTHRE